MTLARRTVLGLLVTCLIAGLLMLLLEPRSAAAQTAAKLAGQRWYQLSLGDRKIGYYVSDSGRREDGSFGFATELRFALTDGGAVTVRDSYQFAAAEPHRLLKASHELKRDGGRLSVQLNSISDGYQARIRRENDSSERRLDWDYTLADYLAVEHWLDQQTPMPGARITTRSLNLGRLAMEREIYELTSRDSTGYELSNPAMLDDTRIRLSRQLIPERFRLAGVFDLVRVDQRQAVAAPEPLTAVSYRASLDRTLPRTSELRRLSLRARATASTLSLPDPLVLRDNPIVPDDGANYLAATLEYPSDHPRLQRLVRDLGYQQPAVSPAETAERVRALVSYVHRFIRYDRGNVHLPVLEVLRERRGDCTEYADLFTSLARAAGIPARTVIGMAYTEENGPALAFHAWNQVRLDDRWQAVDPTWDQFRVDATHWPLPADDRTALLLLTGQVELSFAVLTAEYRDGNQFSAGR